MKRKLLILISFFSLLYGCCATPPGELTQMTTKQALVIAKKLKLDDDKTKRFVATYTDCQAEMFALRPPRPDFKPANDAQADSIIKVRFDHSAKILDLRKKYYKEYRKFLTPMQIERVYHYEGKLMREFHKKERQRSRMSHREKRMKPGERFREARKGDGPRRGARAQGNGR